MISFGSEFHSFGAVAENDLSKREVLDLCTDRSHLLLTTNCDCEFQMWASIGLKCIQELDHLTP